MSFLRGAFKRRVEGRLIVGLLAATALAALLPAAAMASASANIRRTPGASAAFTLPGSNGYSLYFRSEKGVLTIIASQRRPIEPTISATGKLIPGRTGTASESIYSIAGLSRDPSTIDADLGPAGKVSLVFQPSGEKKVTTFDLSGKSERCVGPTKVVRRLGSFVGTVSFHGENGYTTAEATSVPGTVGTSGFRNCTTIRPHPKPHSSPQPPPHPTPPLALLDVGSKDDVFVATRSKRASFSALGFEELGGGLVVLRIAHAVAPQSSFSVRPDGTQASVRPPAPFAGTGVYRDSDSGPPTWSGDLSVSFPGLVRPLTGEQMLAPSLRIEGKKG